MIDVAVLAHFPRCLAPWTRGLPPRLEEKHSKRDFFYALAEETSQTGPECLDNYAKWLFREQAKYNLHPLELSNLAANLLGAGTDTMSSTLITAVLAMRAFPETVLPAWEELDQVVGNSRSPRLIDDLPYIRAFVKEVFRWRSISPVGGEPNSPNRTAIGMGFGSQKALGFRGTSGPSIITSENFLNRIASGYQDSSTVLKNAPFLGKEVI